jgi:putative transposase
MLSKVTTFLANAEIAMDPSKAVKEYKDELIKTQVQNELVGKVTVEKEWLVKKLKSLGLSNRKQLVDLKPSLLNFIITEDSMKH